MKSNRKPNDTYELRIDFIQTDLKQIDDTHFNVTLIPDPQRYELKTEKGEEVYFDKLEGIYIPVSEIKRICEHDLKNCPILMNDRKIDNIEEYTRNRISILRSNFKSIQGSYEFKDQSEILSRLSKNGKSRFVICSIDLIGSTKMSQDLIDTNYVTVINVFLGEVSQIIYDFNGYVLKYTGDGLIAYFPEPNYIGMNDASIDCALSIKYFILNGLNAILSENDLPELSFRIGLDSGEVKVATFGSINSKAYIDLIGPTVNLATKIQGLAGKNQVLAGETTIKNSHLMYREIFQKIDLPTDWNYLKGGSEERYSVYASKH